jgi:hypothetical protein
MRHPVRHSHAGSNPHDHSRKVIERIADTLRCPIETLLETAHSEAYPDETAELIRLWFKIQDDTTRKALLDQIRVAAGEPSR